MRLKTPVPNLYLIFTLPGHANFLRSWVDRQTRLALVALRVPQPAAHGVAEDAAGDRVGDPVLAAKYAACGTHGGHAVQPWRIVFLGKRRHGGKADGGMRGREG